MSKRLTIPELDELAEEFYDCPQIMCLIDEARHIREIVKKITETVNSIPDGEWGAQTVPNQERPLRKSVQDSMSRWNKMEEEDAIREASNDTKRT